MPVVAVQLGQCGNQLGEALFGALHEEASRARPSLATAVERAFFAEQHVRRRPAAAAVADDSALSAAAAGGPALRARAVLVDTEPRVVERCLDDDRGRRWNYSGSSACFRQGGAANNWAYGFCLHGPAVADAVEELLRREVETCDRLEGFLALHSVAGGTGSGLGSYALQLVRDVYPKSCLASASVWPFETGEVSVQSYNAALSLAAVYEYADVALLFENERYLDICRKTLREASPSLPSLNTAICESLVRCMMPCQTSAASSAGASCPLLRLSGDLCAHPLYRLVLARSLPQVSPRARAFHTDTWAGLQRRLVAMCARGSVVDLAESGTSEASGQHAGGCAASSAAFMWGAGAMDAPLDGLRGLPTWRFALAPARVHADAHALGGLERSLGHVSTCRAVAAPLRAAGSKAAAMFRACAYVHQYERYGLSKDELSYGILQLAQVASDYERL